MGNSRQIRSDFQWPAIPGPRSGRPNYRETTFDIRNITPVLGGGPVAGVADTVTPVRGTAVRGHLRFWWRAKMRARGVESLAKLETSIWGSASEPGLVELEVETLRASTAIDNWSYYDSLRERLGSQSLAAKYVLFPLQRPSRSSPKEAPEAKAGVTEDVHFRLKLCCLDDAGVIKSVWSAVQSWIWFGGLGARTRRGLGALYCRELCAADQTVAARTVFPPSQESLGIPELVHKLLLGPQALPAQSAWLNVISLYREFRQGTMDKRKIWPETGLIREVASRRGDIGEDSCPRASLGLPIVFHFKDARDQGLNSELMPENSDRMSSPVILKPLAIGDGSKALPAIVPLRTAGVPGGRLKLKFSEDRKVTLTATGSAIEELLAFARSRGYKG